MAVLRCALVVVVICLALFIAAGMGEKENCNLSGKNLFILMKQNHNSLTEITPNALLLRTFI